MIVPDNVPSLFFTGINQLQQCTTTQQLHRLVSVHPSHDQTGKSTGLSHLLPLLFSLFPFYFQLNPDLTVQDITYSVLFNIITPDITLHFIPLLHTSTTEFRPAVLCPPSNKLERS